MVSHFNKKGVALVLALVIIVVSAGLLAAIMYFSTTGTEIAGMQRKYHNAKEASLGGIEMLTKEITPRVLAGENLSTMLATLTSASIIPAGSIVAGQTDTCFASKMSSNTADWTGCVLGTNPLDPNDNPDVTFNLSSVGGSTRPIEVNLKIVDSAKGNSETSTNDFLVDVGVVNTGNVAVRHVPYVYTIMAEGKLKNSTSPSTDKVTLEVLYAY